ncbi:TetR/AcrR family transcriptional regulator [Arthrobacter sp. StoSoilB5]|uniref:TetR/AcrR family transcriptional regulator n=1 Tax=Arthrobacter sp. StoSoilB5 TaxID=2830992 RepID=UPI001CC4F853|nr:TetR/AcrR family transcriptional regulator [Arthrobacter sp. StoSoilB5]BCW44797.1 TetR family transcriptional regulator [Arthrobacter sp. StoSoilB5]
MNASQTVSPRGPYANTPRRKTEIVAAAAEIFSESGYHGGSLRQIARHLDLSFTSVKHHFPTKENLLIAVLEANDELELAQVQSDEINVGFIDSAVSLAEHNLNHRWSVRLLAVLGAEATSPDHPAHQWFIDRYERIRGVIMQAITEDITAGRVPNGIDPREVAAEIVGLWDGLQLQWLLDPEFDIIASLRRGFRAILVPGIDEMHAGTQQEGVRVRGQACDQSPGH